MTKKSTTKPLFYLIALAIPVLVLALAEGLLRAVGYGQSYPLFVPSEQFPGYAQPNPKVINRYFPDPSVAPKVSPDTVYFDEQKSPDTFRIVIQGGSSAAGFPYGRFGSLQGMLEQRFKRLYPTKKIEVINTAMAAVNSYTLLDFADEILAIDPDLVLIYTGHNEFLGVMGAGSTFAAKGSRWATLAFLELKDLKLYQLIQQAIFALQGEAGQPQASQRTLMEKVAQGKQIPFDSETYLLGVSQFSGNLADLLQRYEQAGIPVLIGNLVAIEKHMQPFSSVGKIKDSPELKAYQTGMAQLAQNQFEQALAALTQAKDLDQMRFRAPSEFNRIIAQLAKQYDNVELVDVEAKFRADTADGILGYKHLLEHVHPTKRGYFLLAEAFVDELKKVQAFTNHRDVSSQQAWLDVPVTELNAAYGELKIKQLTSGYPFRAETIPMPQLDQSQFIYPFLLQRLQGRDWLAIQHDLQQAYVEQNNFVEAARVAGVIADALPNSLPALSMAGQLYMRLTDYKMAMYYQTKALNLAPKDVNSLLNMAHSLFLTEQFDASLRLLAQAKQLQPNNVRIQFFIDRVSAGARDAAQ